MFEGGLAGPQAGSLTSRFDAHCRVWMASSSAITDDLEIYFVETILRSLSHE